VIVFADLFSAFMWRRKEVTMGERSPIMVVVLTAVRSWDTVSPFTVLALCGQPQERFRR
jgi:hypothetical protein